MNNKLHTIITNIIQENSNNFSDNKIFALLSILVLTESIEIYNTNVKLNQLDSNKNSSPSLKNMSNLGNLSGLLNQLQGGDSNNLQQMLPLLMGALGGNNNLDMSKISSILNSVNSKKTESSNKNDNEKEASEQNNNDDKKKISQR